MVTVDGVLQLGLVSISLLFFKEVFERHTVYIYILGESSVDHVYTVEIDCRITSAYAPIHCPCVMNRT